MGAADAYFSLSLSREGALYYVERNRNARVCVTEQTRALLRRGFPLFSFLLGVSKSAPGRRGARVADLQVHRGGAVCVCVVCVRAGPRLVCDPRGL